MASTVESSAMIKTKTEKGVAEFYDEMSGLWESLWGDHMHQGYYVVGEPVDISAHRSAQILMVEKVLQFAGVSDYPGKKPKNIVDVGCGIGGVTTYLAKKYGANAWGFTISPVQTDRATALAVAEGLGDKVSFQVADALDQPYPDEKFDLVWSMECADHVPNKSKFVSEMARVAAPGATIILVTYCLRDEVENLTPDEKNLLKKISAAHFWTESCSASEYVKFAQSYGLEEIKTENWTDNIAPFWPAVLRNAFTLGGFISLLRSGWKTIKGALAMPTMIEGYTKKLVNYTIITCRKPLK